MTNLVTVAADKYITVVYPNGTHPSQALEVHQAFISGMSEMLMVLDHSSNNLDEDQAAGIIRDHSNAIIEYFIHRAAELHPKENN